MNQYFKNSTILLLLFLIIGRPVFGQMTSKMKKSVYPAKYSFAQAAEFQKNGDFKKAIWIYINLYPTHRDSVIKELKKIPSIQDKDAFIKSAFLSYFSFDPEISFFKSDRVHIRDSIAIKKSKWADDLIANVSKKTYTPLGQSILKNKKQIELQASSLRKHLGEQFVLSNIVESNGQEVNLDFTKSEYTIIDFWFKGCRACINEMQQFEKLLKAKDQKVTVISISINQYWLWTQLLSNPGNRYSFLNSKLPNWKQYDLKAADSAIKNLMSFKRIDEVTKKYNITFYPAYFVLDKNGVIQLRPLSAVSFIRQL